MCVVLPDVLLYLSLFHNPSVESLSVTPTVHLLNDHYHKGNTWFIRQ